MERHPDHREVRVRRRQTTVDLDTRHVGSVVPERPAVHHHAEMGALLVLPVWDGGSCRSVGVSVDVSCEPPVRTPRTPRRVRPQHDRTVESVDVTDRPPRPVLAVGVHSVLGFRIVDDVVRSERPGGSEPVQVTQLHVVPLPNTDRLTTNIDPVHVEHKIVEPAPIQVQGGTPVRRASIEIACQPRPGDIRRPDRSRPVHPAGDLRADPLQLLILIGNRRGDRVSTWSQMNPRVDIGRGSGLSASRISGVFESPLFPSDPPFGFTYLS